MFLHCINTQRIKSSVVGRLKTLSKLRRKALLSEFGVFNVVFLVIILITVISVGSVKSIEDDTSNEILQQAVVSHASEVPEEQVVSTDEEAAKRMLDKLEQEVHAECHNRALKEWLYATNITAENRKAAAESAVSYSRFWKNTWKSIIKYDWRTFKDPEVRRQFELLSVLGMSILPESKLLQYNQAKQAMESTYAMAKICSYHNRSMCTLDLEPELSEIYKQSHDPEELKYYWVQWREVSGKKMRKNFTDMMAIMDLAAKMNNFSDAAEYDVRAFRTPTFRDDIEKIWQQMKPFYEQLHAYVRFKLRQFYGEAVVPKKQPIPAHLLGNMWGQTWENVYDLLVPFPNKSTIDVTAKMIEKKLTPHDLAKMSENFFVSLNLSAMPPEFWNGSILEKPPDREMICHASAWDMCNRKDFWIKQCVRINEEDLITLHHEMGHIQYQLQYKHLPKVFRDGANPGFHEAIGDLISISVQTPQHLHAIGLLDTVENDYEADLNYLLRTALVKIAFLPYGYLMDLWRWDVYTGKTSNEDLNCHWWELREKYQGVYPPVQRSENDFDPGSKFHVASNVAYIRYFVSMILQFQFHEALCITAGEISEIYGRGKPLYKCDIYKSKEAGEKLGAMLQMGASKPWEDAMEVVTGVRTMDAKPMLEYFDPLMKWLINENRKNGEYIGWESPPEPSCVKTTSTEATSSPSPPPPFPPTPSPPLPPHSSTNVLPNRSHSVHMEKSTVVLVFSASTIVFSATMLYLSTILLDRNCFN